MPTAEIHNNRLYYELHGMGPPLVLIGGFTHHIGIWHNLLPTLSRYFRVLAFDNRGAGRSDIYPPYSIDQLSDDTAALMEALSIPSASIIGLSMGTMILQALALRYPKKVKQSVMISPFSAIPATARFQAETQLKLFQTSIDRSLAIELLIPWLYSSTFLSEPNRANMLQQQLQCDPHSPSISGYQGQLSAMIQARFTDRLSQIASPLLLIAGEEDICILPQTAKKMAHLLPHAQVKVIPKVGHLPHIENPHAVFRAIATFLKLEPHSQEK